MLKKKSKFSLPNENSTDVTDMILKAMVRTKYMVMMFTSNL